MNRLEELILAGRIDEALDHVAQMSVDCIASLMDDETVMQAPEMFDAFIRRLYETADTPYRRGEIDYTFGGLYIGPLVRLDHWEFTARDLTLNSLSGLTKQLAQEIEQMALLVGAPESPVSRATHERLRGYAKQLRAMDFRSTPEERELHEQKMTRVLGDIGENTAEWLEKYRGNQFPSLADSNESSPGVPHTPQTRSAFWKRFSIFKRKSKHG